MRNLLLFSILLLGVKNLNSQSEKVISNNQFSDPFLAGVINICIQENPNEQFPLKLTQFLQNVSAIEISKKFPHARKPENSFNKRGEKLADLSGIYRVTFPENTDLIKIIDALKKMPEVKYAEPHFIPSLCYVPNDTRIAEQYSLTRLNAFAAWDLHQGDTSVVVGITDTGYDPFHPDLTNNIQRNYADPINGIDDDNDGYIDNFMGWDTGSNDNNPTSDGNYHGQHVSGLSSASTDNATGVAGTGFKCRFIHVKVANVDGILSGAYEGIVYAADHGCKVINCSWGGTTYSEMNADVVRYAAINKDCAVFGGAGNNSDENAFYPAMYPYAMAVGSTNNQDFKSGFSNYGYNLDLFAPGDLVLSTWSNGDYYSTGGTSMSSPTAAGCAALLRAAFPNYSSQQICEQLKVTCDQVDNLSSNLPYQGKMGYGRINMFRSLSETGHPSIVMNEIDINDSGLGLFLPGDTILLTGTIINYLSNAANVNLELISLNSNFQIINPTRIIGPLANLETLDIQNDPFKIIVGAAVGFNELLTVQLHSDADGFLQTQTFSFPVNADFINVQNNQIQTSIGGNSLIGVTGSTYLPGLGFQFNHSQNLMYQGGLMLGLDNSTVYDNVRGNSGDDSDWNTLQRLTIEPIVQTGIEVYSGIMEVSSPTLPIITGVRVISDQNAPNDQFVILEYRINNPSTVAYNQVYAGIFTDWDLIDYSSNRAGYQSTLKLGYVYTAPVDSIYTGVQVLTEQQGRQHAIENISGGLGGVNLFDGFSSSEKYLCLSTSQDIGGMTGNGTDIINVVSAGPFSVQPGEEQIVAFALLAAGNFTELTEAAVTARDFYLNTGGPLKTTAFEQEWLVYPNPAEKELFIKRKINSTSNVNVTVLDISGRILLEKKMLENENRLELPSFSSGVYYLKLESENGIFTTRFVIQHN
ncbi:MAG TPA: S8 family peptidase [Flavobacteriales bacterium]|nr:S8 family peptidase [Flavobacteriales bacterium]